MRDPFAERQARLSLKPEDVLRHNALQKILGGFPIDPYQSEDVERAVESIIKVLREKGKTNDMKYVVEATTHTMREDGPYAELTEEERQRVVDIVTDYFSPEGN